MTDIIAVDVGGTNARFARATLDARGVPQMGAIHKYRVADHVSLRSAWDAFARDDGKPLPDAASIAFATAIDGDVIKLTNSNWTVRPRGLSEELGLDHVRLVNDFEAVAHAVSKLPMEDMPLLFGPDRALPRNGAVTVLGPGTGLGVAMIAYDHGRPLVLATEGGHLDFAPLDPVEGRLLDHLRQSHRRVSVERIVSGPALKSHYEQLAIESGASVPLLTDSALWAAALDGDNALARTALERLCASYGSVAGDLALAHGADTVVLAGGLTQRMRELLLSSAFHDRFTAKGRFERLMASIPVRLAIHPEIGLYGAAAAYREEEE